MEDCEGGDDEAQGIPIVHCCAMKQVAKGIMILLHAVHKPQCSRHMVFSVVIHYIFSWLFLSITQEISTHNLPVLVLNVNLTPKVYRYFLGKSSGCCTVKLLLSVVHVL